MSARESPASTTTPSAPSGHEGPVQAEGVDVTALAERVYQLMRAAARLDRARGVPTRGE